MKRRFVALALTAPFLLGACGTDVAKEAAPAATAAQTANVKNVSEITAGSTFNDTDVMFLQMLVDNQEQGQQMVEIAVERAQRQDVVDMAKAVDRDMVISGVRLVEKTGGKSGDYRAE